MLNSEWKRLKSGTDIRGTASGGVQGEKVNLTDDVVCAVTHGFLIWAKKRLNKSASKMKIAVGRDSRISGPKILKTVCETLKESGVSVLNCSLASTPSMFMTTVDLGCDCAVQITASHHPFQRNGLKFFTRSGGLEADDIEEILQFAQDGAVNPKAECGSITDVDYMKKYAENLREPIKREVNSEDFERPLAGFHIVVDAGNGAGGFYARGVLEKLGADVSGSQFLEPDGMFPNHIPNPENEQAMEFVCKAVLENKADLGVIFDTDVDRGGVVGKSGKEINRNRLVAIASAIALEGKQGGYIVTDSITSSGLKEYIENVLHGCHYRYRRGYKNVINKAIELNNKGIDCPLAIETSGHAAMRENYFLDDGAYLCTKIIIKMAQLKKEGKSIDGLLDNLKEPAESKEIRIKIKDEDFRACGERIIKELLEYSKAHNWQIADDNREGVRVSFGKDSGNGWFLLRLSVHDPIMPLNIESDEKGGADVILSRISEFLKTADGIDF